MIISCLDRLVCTFNAWNVEPAVFGSVRQQCTNKDTAYSDTLIDTEKQCVLEFWKYDTTKLSNDKHTDILSLAVCFDKDADARIQMEIENLLNEKVWN